MLAALVAAGVAAAADIAGRDVADLETEDEVLINNPGEVDVLQINVSNEERTRPQADSSGEDVWAQANNEKSKSVIGDDAHASTRKSAQSLTPPQVRLRGLKSLVVSGIALAFCAALFNSFGFFVSIPSTIVVAILVTSLIEISASAYERNKIRKQFVEAEGLLQYLPDGDRKHLIQRNMKKPVPPKRPLSSRFFKLQLTMLVVVTFMITWASLLPNRDITDSLPALMLAPIVLLPLGTLWFSMSHLLETAIWKLKRALSKST